MTVKIRIITRSRQKDKMNNEGAISFLYIYIFNHQFKKADWKIN